jgi:P2-related tail formation protein
MSTTLRGSRLIENCTPSISYDNQVKAASTAFDNQMWEIIDDTGQVIMIPNIMHIDDPKLIDILAWQFHVDFYDPTRDLEFRKMLVQHSIIWHKTKGTPYMVNTVLDTYWRGGAHIEEWFTYKSPWPPQFPTINLDTLAGTFRDIEIDTAGNKFMTAMSALKNDQPISFKLGDPANALPAPLVENTTYYVVNKLALEFQIAATQGGAPIDIIDAGRGTNQIWAKSYGGGAGSWHERYKFRIIIDNNVIRDPQTVAQVLHLIDHHKPESRWPDQLIPHSGASLGNLYLAAYALTRITRQSLPPPIRT